MLLPRLVLLLSGTHLGFGFRVGSKGGSVGSTLSNGSSFASDGSLRLQEISNFKKTQYMTFVFLITQNKVDAAEAHGMRLVVGAQQTATSRVPLQRTTTWSRARAQCARTCRCLPQSPLRGAPLEKKSVGASSDRQSATCQWWR
jgi:hypothetical protein